VSTTVIGWDLGGFVLIVVNADIGYADSVDVMNSMNVYSRLAAHLYLSGTCVASGGEPIDEAVQDKKQPNTFCCRSGNVFAD